MDGTQAARRSNQWFRALVVVAMIVGLVLRLWNVDFDQRQHQHPDERFWAITADALAKQPAPAPHGTVLGPVLENFVGSAAWVMERHENLKWCTRVVDHSDVLSYPLGRGTGEAEDSLHGRA